MKKTLLLSLLAVFSLNIQATQPPTQEQITQYKKQGIYKQRVEAAKSLNTHRFNKQLVRDFAKKHISGHKSSPLKNESERSPLDGYFPSTGSPKMLVLLVEFQDYVHSEINNQASVENRIFGEGNPDEYPYDSQRNFYLRSSYNQLDIQGNVLDWYQTDYDRPLDEGNSWEVKQRVIKDAINYHDAQGHDFSQYDNDGDGDIDYLAVIWTGPTGAWASLWWGTFSGFYDDSFVVDGKTISTISWQQISYSEDEGPFSPSTLIHETGHALGLPDFYDYDRTIGPQGGVGGMDQMGGNHDHNSFSKYILGWLTPTVVGADATDVSLQPYSENPSALLINKGATEETKWDEFFIAEYRDQKLNDQGLPNSGLVIWHIDATLSEWGWFENDNSFTDNKLIRLVQADALEEIELGPGWANAGDFFTTGGEFSPNSEPQSRLNSGEHSGVSITNINHQENKMDLNARVYESVPNISITSLADKALIRPGDNFTVSIADTSELKSLELYSGEQLIHSFSEAPFELVLTNDILSKGAHKLKLVATNLEGAQSTEYRDIVYFDGEAQSLVVHLDYEADDKLTALLAGADTKFIQSEFIVPLSINDFPVVHLNFGSNKGHWTDVDGDGIKSAAGISRAATEYEIGIIRDYLEQGGKLILEGEAVLRLTTELQTLLGVNVTHSNVQLNNISGENLFNDKSIDVAINTDERLVEVDLIESANDDESMVLLSGTGQHYDFDTDQWLESTGTCSLSKTLPSSGAKIVISTCLVRSLNRVAKADVYNTYLEHFDIAEKLTGNVSPQLNAGTDQEVNEGDNVDLTGTASDDDGDNLTIEWTQTEGTAVSLTSADQLTLSFTAPNVTSDTVLTFELKVSDGFETVTDSVSITVKNVSTDNGSGNNNGNNSGASNSSSSGGMVNIYFIIFATLLLSWRRRS